MSFATVYIIVVFMIPAALGVLLLTLVSLDELGARKGSYMQKPLNTPRSNTQSDSLAIGALFHHGATQ